MGKDIKKTSSRDRIKTIAVRWAAEKFGVDKNYVYGILKGTHVAGQCEEIKKAFDEKYKELKGILSI